MAQNRFHVQSVASINLILTVMAFMLGVSLLPHPHGILLGAFFAILPLVITLGFYRHQFGSYQAFIFLTIAGYPQLFRQAEAGVSSLVVPLVLNTLLLGYVIFVRRRIFPDMAWFTPRKDPEGSYRFSD